nr:unnamed protein product [Digitaria exilis]
MLAYTSTSKPWPQRHPPSPSQGAGFARHVARAGGSKRRGAGTAAAEGVDETAEAAERMRSLQIPSPSQGTGAARHVARAPGSKRRGSGAVAAAEGVDEAAEAAELVRSLLRRTAGGKERLVPVLDRNVRVVRTEHCFLLFEELGRRDAWLQCLEVDILFKDLDESIVSPDIYTYNGVIDAYGKNDSYGRKQTFDKMEQVFKSLLRSKERPTHPTFNSMITNYGKARLRGKAESVLRKMEEMGFKPNYVTQECLIMMYAHCDCVSKARQIFDELVSLQNKVHLSSLNAMLDAYCMNGLHIEADRLLDTVLQKGVVPSGSTYKLLYKAYTKANDKVLVQKLLKRMNKQGIVPNKKFFLDALEAFGTSERKPRASSATNSASNQSSDSAGDSETVTSNKPEISVIAASACTHYTLDSTTRHSPWTQNSIIGAAPADQEEHDY